MQALPEYQKSFYQAIFSNEQSLLQEAIGDIEDFDERFRIYSNNVFGSLKSVLKEDFPVCERVLGEDQFNRAAFEYVRNFPPTSGCLLVYGHLFANCLEALYPDTPYIKAIAQIEWAMKELYYASDSVPLDPRTLGEIPIEQYESLAFKFPKASCFVKSDYALRDIWCTEESLIPVHQSSYCLIIRPRFRVEQYWLEEDEYSFLSTLNEGKCLGAAYQEARAVNRDFNLAENLGTSFKREYFTQAAEVIHETAKHR